MSEWRHYHINFYGGPIMDDETKDVPAYDFYHPIPTDRDPDEDWSIRDHDGMDSDYEAEPPLVKATRVWDGVVAASRA